MVCFLLRLFMFMSLNRKILRGNKVRPSAAMMTMSATNTFCECGKVRSSFFCLVVVVVNLLTIFRRVCFIQISSRLVKLLLLSNTVLQLSDPPLPGPWCCIVSTNYVARKNFDPQKRSYSNLEPLFHTIKSTGNLASVHTIQHRVDV